MKKLMVLLVGGLFLLVACTSNGEEEEAMPEHEAEWKNDLQEDAAFALYFLEDYEATGGLALRRNSEDEDEISYVNITYSDAPGEIISDFEDDDFIEEYETTNDVEVYYLPRQNTLFAVEMAREVTEGLEGFHDTFQINDVDVHTVQATESAMIMIVNEEPGTLTFTFDLERFDRDDAEAVVAEYIDAWVDEVE